MNKTTNNVIASEARQASNNLVIFVGGATATGKTKFALKLANELHGELVSADSMQVYKGFDIGTAKEKTDLAQHCIDIANPKLPFTVVDYMLAAEAAINEIRARGKQPIVVGGTGYYIHSLIYNFNYGAHAGEHLKGELYKRYETEGAEPLYGELLALDPLAKDKVHINNIRRVIRALEYVKATGASYFNQNEKLVKKIDNFKLYVLKAPRDKLYERIESRVSKMFEAGLKKEVETLLNGGLTFEMQSMQGIGYKEWRGYFENNLSLDEVKALIVQNTRRYAKRQETWFNNQYEDRVEIEVLQ
jgi:tRNA dimethylallyltransferase